MVHPMHHILAGFPSRDILQARERQAYDQIAGGVRRVVVFGSGYLGKVIARGAQTAGLDVVAFADNSEAKQGSEVMGIPVLPPNLAVAQYNHNAVFVVGIFHSGSPHTQLRSLGCERLVSFPLFYWRFAKFLPEGLIGLPHRILDDSAEIAHAYDLLSDDDSREEFAAQIRWRMTLDETCLSQHQPLAEMYFAPDLVRLSEQEVLLDGGAFDGDSIQLFLDRVNGRFRHIFALEPDPRNRLRLQSFIASHPGQIAAQISLLPYGLSNTNETVSFTVTGTMGSQITPDSIPQSGGERNTESIEVRRMDDLILRSGPGPTFIKMDIEGAEPHAIEGATETIRWARPIMAVCAYHQCRHLWTLPKLLKAALPDYRIFLRRYADDCWETVYYAIPPERCIREVSSSVYQ